jgi:beta-glucosidase
MAKFDAAYHFPRGFLWGAATASHQVEGGNTNNNWYRWEQTEGKIKNGDKSGLACDWWGGRWKEDFDRAAETGQNAHRLSIEWSRIQPAIDRWDEEALDYYRQIIRGLVERNLTPCVTLHHFSDPLWLTDLGGWLYADAPVLFEKYVRKVVEALKEYVTLWVTINEPNVYTFSSYLLGDFPPGHKSLPEAWQVAVQIARGHAAAYHAIHEIQKEARVGLSINYRCFLPAASWSPLDKLAANIQHQAFNCSFTGAAQTGILKMLTYRANIPHSVGTQDYIGLNYYSRDYTKFDLFSPQESFMKKYYGKDDELSSTGFIANVPEGFYHGFKWAVKYGLPVIVTENGVEDSQDTLRPRYLLQHLYQTWRAVNFNWPVKGYFHWSLVDNFEWERGWSQRFGLWGLDTGNQMRIRRKSVDLYAEICKENGITTAMVEKYAPEIFEKIFPG